MSRFGRRPGVDYPPCRFLRPVPCQVLEPAHYEHVWFNLATASTGMAVIGAYFQHSDLQPCSVLPSPSPSPSPYVSYFISRNISNQQHLIEPPPHQKKLNSIMPQRPSTCAICKTLFLRHDPSKSREMSCGCLWCCNCITRAIEAAFGPWRRLGVCCDRQVRMQMAGTHFGWRQMP